MPTTTTVSYRGWTITAGCLPLAASDDHALHFTSRAVAVLAEPNEACGWAAPRSQTYTISDGIFASREACVAELLAHTKNLIDAEQAFSSCVPPYSLYAKMIRAAGAAVPAV